MNRLTMLALTLLTALSLACGSVATAPLDTAAVAQAAAAEPTVAAAPPTAAPTAAAQVTVPQATLSSAVTQAARTESPVARTAPSSATVSAVRADTTTAFGGDSAFQHVDALSVGIGSRPAGADVQTQTHQYLMDQYQKMGYQTELQTFPITSYQDHGSSLTMRGTPDQDVDANTLQYSFGGVVEAQLVEAGIGRPEEYEAAGVAGKVVLVNRGELRFADKVNGAAAAGAVAVIIVNNQTGNFNGSLIRMSTIPAVGVSQTEGDSLRQIARAGGMVRVEVDATLKQSTAANVVATRAGGPETLVIGGHIDSVAAGPGANDNASGTAVVLELARIMATRETPYTLKFVGFDAEEIGLIGSAHYVSQLSESEKRSIVAMINLDMVGVGTTSRVGGSESLTRIAEEAAQRSGLQVGLMGEAGASDHASFTRAGVPGLFIHRSNDPNYHSPNDKAEFVDPANLQIAGQLALDVIAELERGE